MNSKSLVKTFGFISDSTEGTLLFMFKEGFLNSGFEILSEFSGISELMFLSGLIVFSNLCCLSCSPSNFKGLISIVFGLISRPSFGFLSVSELESFDFFPIKFTSG